MSDIQIEQTIQEKELTAPRVTLTDIDAAIDHYQHYVFPDTTTTVVCITLQNGYTVIGESVCASPENFDEELGVHIAFENAKRKIWALEGYLLKDKLKAGR